MHLLVLLLLSYERVVTVNSAILFAVVIEDLQTRTSGDRPVYQRSTKRAAQRAALPSSDAVRQHPFEGQIGLELCVINGIAARRTCSL